MKVKSWIAVALILSFFGAISPVLAAEENSKKAPDQKAMMDAWMKTMTPGEQHKKLQPFVGSFDVKVTTPATAQIQPGGKAPKMNSRSREPILETRSRGEKRTPAPLRFVAAPARRTSPPATGHRDCEPRVCSAAMDADATKLPTPRSRRGHEAQLEIGNRKSKIGIGQSLLTQPVPHKRRRSLSFDCRGWTAQLCEFKLLVRRANPARAARRYDHQPVAKICLRPIGQQREQKAGNIVSFGAQEFRQVGPEHLVEVKAHGHSSHAGGGDFRVQHRVTGVVQGRSNVRARQFRVAAKQGIPVLIVGQLFQNDGHRNPRALDDGLAAADSRVDFNTLVHGFNPNRSE